jgi:hypothetical protein
LLLALICLILQEYIRLDLSFKNLSFLTHAESSVEMVRAAPTAPASLAAKLLLISVAFAVATERAVLTAQELQMARQQLTNAVFVVAMVQAALIALKLLVPR